MKRIGERLKTFADTLNLTMLLVINLFFIVFLMLTAVSLVVLLGADHGPGMDEETKAHIFDEFCQGDTSNKAQGNGPSLSMVRKIVSLHNGRIEVDSEPGHGACFTVYLPDHPQTSEAHDRV
jgi:K+-sensing histidine kinase KdpD